MYASVVLFLIWVYIYSFFLKRNKEPLNLWIGKRKTKDYFNQNKILWISAALDRTWEQKIKFFHPEMFLYQLITWNSFLLIVLYIIKIAWKLKQILVLSKPSCIREQWLELLSGREIIPEWFCSKNYFLFTFFLTRKKDKWLFNFENIY